LNQFITNLAKIIKDQKDKIKISELEINDMQKLSKETIDAYTKKLSNQRDIIKAYKQENVIQDDYDEIFNDMNEIHPETDIIPHSEF
jgi:non-homologous end joining protein Ku